jgi:exodeoxyribonuclease V alpha subunit
MASKRKTFDRVPSGQESTIVGTIESIVFFSEADHYTVANLLPEGERTHIVIVGNLIGVSPGETVRVWGRPKRSLRYGEQFLVSHFQAILPATVTGITRYLSSGLIKGIGPTFAKRIVQRFKEDTLRIIDEDVERLRGVSGIGPKRIELIRATWEKHKHIRELMLFLQTHGVSTSLALKIYKQYKDNALRVLSENPYQIAMDISGIGFKTADAIAQQLGFPKDSPLRAEAGIVHILNEFSEEGHSFCPYETLVEHAGKMLEITDQTVRDSLKKLRAAGKVVLEKLREGENAVFIKALHVSEKTVAQYLLSLIRTGKPYPAMDISDEISRFESSYHFTLADEQRQALRAALAGGVLVITGGPGTGKTTTIRGIIKILTGKGLRILLAAPTGRAARRLSEVTQMHATTIHRLLKYNPGEATFTFNNANPLKADLIIIDESSMLDVVLAHHLLKAISPTTSLIFVGDVDQLPSVGPGNILKDVIASGKVEVVRLEKIFRQARRSLIITNAHRINKGEFPYLPTDKGGRQDFFFIERKEPEEALEAIKKLVQRRIPERFKFRPIEDVQVICPMYKGVLGAINLNRELQNLLNPGQNSLVRGSLALRIGDKVMQLRNNYDKDVFNGDIGIVVGVDTEYQTVKVRFDHHIVIYDFDDLDELCLSYAISVHKAQGSEYPAVIIPLHTQHYIMLQRNLLYTALTRGRRLVCIVGNKPALAIAIHNNRIQKRFSGLRQWLQYADL